MIDRRLRWLYVAIGLLGGVALGVGLGELRFAVTLRAAFWTVLGVVLLWWSFAARRKAPGASPEGEPSGTHTID
ncbi:MAG: hypothetical protein M3409_09265 [Gemmatimonadota bacterium]|jgi:hypothetical protein|nr:hypothetical protein [Gemmatimonadota bacterium]